VATTPRPLPEILAEAAAAAATWYAGYTWELVGHPPTGQTEARIPCPRPKPPPKTAEDGSNADLILTTLGEADRPLTVVEIGFKATGSDPTGALRRALSKLIRDGQVREYAGPPKTYELT
jgi:hypothetical protein